ncbi:MAG: Nif3-like dinuclear metal center hexameric protein, partial [Ignavibacteria bacterium]
WAPKEIAWEKDNVGLQVGSGSRQIKNIMLCLELTEGVVKEAVKKNCSFIITHHPLLFRPLNKINTEKDKISKLVSTLIKKDITLYSAHTNLDFTKDGVSHILAKKLQLDNIKFLEKISDKKYKLVVFVPENSVKMVSRAIHNAGGGIIGNYTRCSFRLKGTGTFKGTDESKPAIGVKDNLEYVDEIRLEVLVDNWKVKSVVNAMIKAHPYEEVAYDIYPLKNETVNYGMGAIGILEKPLKRNAFLTHVCKSLKTKNLRFTNSTNRSIRKVAVCGGSCSDMLNSVIASGADAFVTADIKYHTFQDAEDNILLIDAGHYETEVHVLEELNKRLKSFTRNKSDIKVFKYGGSTNPVNFYKN